ncbi:MAG: hypothetical protein KC420_05715 [Myxococcales bacterium]|nr:hypothetical protein [Myxococcales bacterium]
MRERRSDRHSRPLEDELVERRPPKLDVAVAPEGAPLDLREGPREDRPPRIGDLADARARFERSLALRPNASVEEALARVSSPPSGP